MLTIENLSVHYGVIQAIKNVNFHVEEGDIVSLIGANGAGKTTILRTISGLKKSSEGTIVFKERQIQGMVPQAIVASGISHVPEGRHIFTGLTVQENLEMGAFLRKEKQLTEEFEAIFTRFPILKERKNQEASTLSGGEQQMLAMGRALMSKPQLLLLDEPTMGLAPIYIQEIFNIIQEINRQGTTVLLIEQNAKMALSIAHRGYVLETGQVALQGKGDELLKSEEVKMAYLGG